MRKTGLFFGSFNPIHIGHLILANYILEFSDLEELWFVVSPQNPFKEKKTLLQDHHRLEMVRRAIEHYPKMRASDIEFSMPQPSYTIDTLAFLSEKYQDRGFFLIMGEDNLTSLHKWKNADVLIKNYPILVYPRASGEPVEHNYKNHPHFHFLEAPKIEISATKIREMIAKGKNYRPMVPPEVFAYLDGSFLYQNLS